MEALSDIQSCLTGHLNRTNNADVGHVIAYADDVNFSCPTSCVQEFGTDVKNILAGYDIPLAVDKCSIFGRGVEALSPPPFPVARHGLRRVLGVPIGPPPFRREVLRTHLQRMAAPLPTIVRLPTQLAYILTTQCINLRACYVARIVEMEDDRSALEDFDAAIDDALLTISDSPPSHRPTLSVIRSLPQRLGGLGVRDSGGLYGLLDQNKSRAVTMDFLDKHRLSPLYRQCLTSWRVSELHDGHTVIPDETPSPVIMFELARDLAKDRRTELANKILSDKINAGELADAAKFRSGQTANSARWTTFRGDLQGRFVMHGSTYRCALQRKILAPPTPRQLLDQSKPCRCGASATVRAHATHDEDCASNQYYYNSRHHTIARLIKRFLECTYPDAPVHHEALVPGAPQNDRMDVILERGSGKYYIDITITNPACVTNLRKGAAVKNDAASDARAEDKIRKYAYIPSLPGSVPHHFIPFVIESTGRLGKHAVKFLKDCSDELNPRPLSMLLTSISACIALYNSLMAANSTRRLNKEEELIVADEH